MELDIVAVLDDLINEIGGIHHEINKEYKDTDSLWYLYGKLCGYKKVLDIMAKACKDESGVVTINRISNERCNNLIKCIETEFGFRTRRLLGKWAVRSAVFYKASERVLSQSWL